VRARGQRDGQPFERWAGGLFFVHQPGAHLAAGSVHAAPRDGNLVLTADLKIERAGTYWAYAELWGGTGEPRPIAFARERLERLERGPHRVELLFGGQILREAGVDAPYTLRNLRLKQVDTHPAQEGEPLDSSRSADTGGRATSAETRGAPPWRPRGASAPRWSPRRRAREHRLSPCSASRR
jgi:hypothetical protein